MLQTNTITKTKKMLSDNFFLQKVKDSIAANYQDELYGLPDLCKDLLLSRTQVYRKIISITGVSPSEYIKIYRLEKAKVLLQSTDKSISEIAHSVGFREAGYFTKVFKAHFGYLPSEV